VVVFEFKRAKLQPVEASLNCLTDSSAPDMYCASPGHGLGAGWQQVRQIFKTWWHRSTSSEYLSSWISRRKHAPKVWAVIFACYLAFDFSFLVRDSHPPRALSAAAKSTIAISDILGLLLSVPLSMMGWNRLNPDVCIGSFCTLYAILSAYLNEGEVGDLASAVPSCFASAVLSCFCVLIGVHSSAIICCLFAQSVGVLAVCGFDLSVYPLLCAIPFALCSLIWEYNASVMLDQVESKQAALMYVIDHATSGYCDVELSTGRVTFASEKLDCALMLEDALVGHFFSDCMCFRHDLEQLQELFEASIEGRELQPILVTLRTPGDSYLDAKLIPYMVCGDRLSLCMQIVGETREALYERAHTGMQASSLDCEDCLSQHRMGTGAGTYSDLERPLLSNDGLMGTLQFDAQSTAGSSNVSFSIADAYCSSPKATSKCVMPGRVSASPEEGHPKLQAGNVKTQKVDVEQARLSACSVEIQTVDAEQVVHDEKCSLSPCRRHQGTQADFKMSAEPPQNSRPPRPSGIVPTVRLNTRKRIHSFFQATPRETWNALITDILYKANGRGSGCCAKHIKLYLLKRFVQDLIAQECEPDFFEDFSRHSHFQCPECFAITEHEPYGDDGNQLVCDSCMAELPRSDTSRDQISSTSLSADSEPEEATPARHARPGASTSGSTECAPRSTTSL